MKEIRFPSNLSLDYPHLVSEALAQCMEVPYGDRLAVDLTETQRVSAFGVAALGARLVWLVRAKRLPSGSTIRRPEAGRVSNDLMRMGLYDLLQQGAVDVFRRQMAERPQELWLVDSPAELPNACRRLMAIVRSVLPATEKDLERVTAMMEALGDNVFRHARSNTGAMLCAQAYPKNGVVEFAVADTGQGIQASLRRFPSLASSVQGDAHAILTSLTLKVKREDGSTRPSFLNTLTATARKTGGEMVCMSGEAALALRRGEMRTSPITFYPGCVVGARLKLLS